LAQRGEQLGRPGQVRLGLVEVAPVGVDQRPVAPQRRLVLGVARPPQRTERTLVAAQRVVEAVEPVEDGRPLQLQPRRRRPLQRGRRPVELAQGGPGASLLHEGAGQAGPGLALALTQAPTARRGERALEVTDGVGDLAQLEGRQPERPLGHRHRVGVPHQPGSAHEVDAAVVRVARRSLGEQEHGRGVGAQPGRRVVGHLGATVPDRALGPACGGVPLVVRGGFPCSLGQKWEDAGRTGP
jgi:hypothetical protein